jgi:hypothetical protein
METMKYVESTWDSAGAEEHFGVYSQDYDGFKQLVVREYDCKWQEGYDTISIWIIEYVDGSFHAFMGNRDEIFLNKDKAFDWAMSLYD